MQPRHLVRLALGLLLGLALLQSPQEVPADEKAATNFEKIKFDTFDQVELHGAYYPSARGNKAPCALLLHEFGGNSQLEGWPELATELQKKGFAVLAFDFRGHGESTEIGAAFYNDPINKTLKGARSAKSRDKISYKDFSTLSHYVTMVNDIAAAKRLLDRKNDSGECNSSDVVVIGAGEGATLGTLWIYSEWFRHLTAKNALGFPVGQVEMAGKHIACAVWLSISPTLGTSRVNSRVAGWIRPPQKVREKLPMYFINGEQEKNAAFAKYLSDSVLKASTDKNQKLTGTIGIQGSNKLAGRELLGKKSLGTEELIVKYLEKVTADRGSNIWTKRNVDNTLLYRVPIEDFLR